MLANSEIILERESERARERESERELTAGENSLKILTFNKLRNNYCATYRCFNKRKNNILSGLESLSNPLLKGLFGGSFFCPVL